MLRKLYTLYFVSLYSVSDGGMYIIIWKKKGNMLYMDSVVIFESKFKIITSKALQLGYN